MDVYYTFNTVGGRWKFRSAGESVMYRVDAPLSEPITVVSFNGRPVIPLDDGEYDKATMWREAPSALKQPVTTCTSVGVTQPSTNVASTCEVLGLPAGAKKYDQGKPMMDLLLDGCPQALLSVGEVLTYGYKKYGGKHGWKALPDAKSRYEAALLRHMLAQATGEVNDPESGLKHAAHIACNALFLLQLQMEDTNATDQH